MPSRMPRSALAPVSDGVRRGGIVFAKVPDDSKYTSSGPKVAHGGASKTIPSNFTRRSHWSWRCHLSELLPDPQTLAALQSARKRLPIHSGRIPRLMSPRWYAANTAARGALAVVSLATAAAHASASNVTDAPSASPPTTSPPSASPWTRCEWDRTKNLACSAEEQHYGDEWTTTDLQAALLRCDASKRCVGVHKYVYTEQTTYVRGADNFVDESWRRRGRDVDIPGK